MKPFINLMFLQQSISNVSKAVLLLFILLPLPVSATTSYNWVIVDGSEVIPPESFTYINGREHHLSAYSADSAEVAYFDLYAIESTATITSTTDSLGGIYFVEPGSGGLTLSDIYQPYYRTFTAYSARLCSGASDWSITQLPPDPCSSSSTIYPQTYMTETGQPQLVSTVTWSDGEVDNIYVCSDVDGVASSCSLPVAPPPVPEPSSIFLFTTGIVGLGIKKMRRGV